MAPCWIRVLICALFVFRLLGGLCFSVSAYAEEPENDFADFHADELSLYAKSAVIIDADTGRILYGKSAQTQMANASTTKILTCILALENAEPDDVVTVSDYACSMPKVKLGFSGGDQFYLRDLLYSLMLESHNDSAVAIAEYVSGSVEAFAALMNEKAESIGCTDSHFVTPNGLDAEDGGGAHQTTAYDLSKIMAYCIQNENFLEITRTASKEISTVDGAKTYSLSNHNALLTMLKGTISGKTGFTTTAGYCYVGAYQSGEHKLTFALLACGWPNHKDYKWSDAKQLISYVETNYSDRVIVQGEETLKLSLEHAVAVTDASKPSSKGDLWRCIVFPDDITAKTSSEKITAFLSETDVVKTTYDLPEFLEAPVLAGTKIGTENILINGEWYASRSVSLAESAEMFHYGWCLNWVLDCFLIG